MCPTVICILPEISNICPVKKQPKTWLQYWKAPKKIVCLHVCTTVINETVPRVMSIMHLESPELFRNLWQTDLNYSQLCFPSGRQLVSFCGLFGVHIFSLPVPAAQVSIAPRCWVLLGCPEKDPWGLWVLPWHWEKETGLPEHMLARCAGMWSLSCRDADPREADSLWQHITHVVHWATRTYIHVSGERASGSVLKSTIQRKENTSGKRLFLKTASIDSSV